MQEEEDDVLRARMNAGRIMAATMPTNATVTAAILNFLDLRVITPNEVSSATRPTRAFHCNLDAMAGFAAAHG